MRATPVLARTAMKLRRGQAVDLVKPSSGEGSGELLGVVLGEGSGGEYSTHAGLDGSFVGAAGFGITDERDELRGQRVHGQAGHRLRADGGVDGAGQQRIPEGGVAGGSRRWCRCGLGRVAGFAPSEKFGVVPVGGVGWDEGVIGEAEDEIAMGQLVGHALQLDGSGIGKIAGPTQSGSIRKSREIVCIGKRCNNACDRRISSHRHGEVAHIGNVCS